MNLGLKLNVLRSLKTNVLSKLNNTVQKVFSDKFLLYTNVGISFSLSGLGDVIEQHYEILTDKQPKWDVVRTRNMCCSGASVGIVCHYWYKYLDRLVPGYTIRIVLKKIVLDQVIGSPLYISTFFLTLGCIEGASLSEIIEDAKGKALKLYVAEWMIWPPAQFINFYLLSTKYRVLFDNTISLGYDVYTSKVVHSCELNQ